MVEDRGFKSIFSRRVTVFHRWAKVPYKSTLFSDLVTKRHHYIQVAITLDGWLNNDCTVFHSHFRQSGYVSLTFKFCIWMLLATLINSRLSTFGTVRQQFNGHIIMQFWTTASIFPESFFIQYFTNLVVHLMTLSLF